MNENSANKNPHKKIIFAVPGSKVYISSFYKNRPKSFLNISLTGSRCSLMCTHCRGKLLKSMAGADGIDLCKIIGPGSCNVTSGVLISGGFNSSGVLDLEGRYGQIKYLKKSFKNLKVFIHAGFVSKKMAHNIKETGCDGVLLNVTGSVSAIENVFNLKGFKPRHYYDSLVNLKEAGLKTAPHIVVGLDNDDKNQEMEALKNILEIGADWLVLVSVKNLFKNAGYIPGENTGSNPEACSAGGKSYAIKKDFENRESNSSGKVNELKRNEENAARILSLAQYSKKACPDLKISLGCAKPSGKTGQILELGLIELGIDSIAFPSEKAIAFAEENNVAYEFVESCCALIL